MAAKQKKCHDTEPYFCPDDFKCYANCDFKLYYASIN